MNSNLFYLLFPNRWADQTFIFRIYSLWYLDLYPLLSFSKLMRLVYLEIQLTVWRENTGVSTTRCRKWRTRPSKPSTRERASNLQRIRWAIEQCRNDLYTYRIIRFYVQIIPSTKNYRLQSEYTIKYHCGEFGVDLGTISQDPYACSGQPKQPNLYYRY